MDRFSEGVLAARVRQVIRQVCELIRVSPAKGNPVYIAVHQLNAGFMTLHSCDQWYSTPGAKIFADDVERRSEELRAAVCRVYGGEVSVGGATHQLLAVSDALVLVVVAGSTDEHNSQVARCFAACLGLACM